MAKNVFAFWLLTLFASMNLQLALVAPIQGMDQMSSSNQHSNADEVSNSHITDIPVTLHRNASRRLQFEGMFESRADSVRKRKKGSKSGKRVTRSQALTNAVEEILLGTDRYVLWWRGPPDENKFAVAEWSEPHRSDHNAIFTMAVIQGGKDKQKCSTPNDLHLFFGSLRRVFDGDIVVAIEASSVTKEVQSILQAYKVVVYILPSDLCSRATHSIFCGSEDERVPASVFRYYFYEIWASLYSEKSFIMISDFHDMLFQSNPLSEKWTTNDWFPEYQIVFFQEFHPNMVINRCVFNAKIMSECYGAEALRQYGGRIILSSGAVMATRDAMVYWSHAMTQVYKKKNIIYYILY